MRYYGGKQRLKKYIVPVLDDLRKNYQTYVEPFVGSGKIMECMVGKRIAGDSNKYVIGLLKAVQNGWIPPDNLSKTEWLKIKKEPDNYSDGLVGFAGFGCSFGGRFFTSYAVTDDKRNYAMNTKNTLLKQKPLLSGVDFFLSDYRDLVIPPNSLIYCDPPYSGSATYKGCEKFDSDIFWEWCRNKAREGHTVVVSEVNPPPDFKTLLDVVTIRSATVKGFTQRVEKLVTYVP